MVRPSTNNAGYTAAAVQSIPKFRDVLPNICKYRTSGIALSSYIQLIFYICMCVFLLFISSSNRVHVVWMILD